MKNNAFNPVDQNDQRQITGGNRLPHFVKVLIRKLLRPTDCILNLSRHFERTGLALTLLAPSLWTEILRY